MLGNKIFKGIDILTMESIRTPQISLTVYDFSLRAVVLLKAWLMAVKIIALNNFVD